MPLEKIFILGWSVSRPLGATPPVLQDQQLLRWHQVQMSWPHLEFVRGDEVEAALADWSLIFCCISSFKSSMAQPHGLSRPYRLIHIVENAFMMPPLCPCSFRTSHPSPLQPHLAQTSPQSLRLPRPLAAWCSLPYPSSPSSWLESPPYRRL